MSSMMHCALSNYDDVGSSLHTQVGDACSLKIVEKYLFQTCNPPTKGTSLMVGAITILALPAISAFLAKSKADIIDHQLQVFFTR